MAACRILLAALLVAAPLWAQQAAAPRPQETLDEAWWTGPMLTPGAGVLPPGHMLIEPYFYDVAAGHAHSYGSFTYLLYGLTRRVTLGLTPNGGFTHGGPAQATSAPQWGDVSVLASIGLTQFHQGSRMPTVSALVEETLPTGRYDRLGDRPGNGYGSGTYTTTFGVYSQTYWWLPNGRLLRPRFNLTQSFSRLAPVHGVSVYGTGNGFAGRAQPGASTYADASWEYSLTQRWVLALDATYRHTGATRVAGVDGGLAVARQLASSDSFAFAPGIEYSWSPHWGVLLALRLIPASHNTVASRTPALAINFVR